MKLKTLKDLTILKRGMSDSQTVITDLWVIKQVGQDVRYCYPEQLRQEAIKHIRNIRDKPSSQAYKIIDWIKMFFNITEEDLK